MKLSIVVLTCNQKGFTLKLLDTLLPILNDERGTELIIIDNGSADGTRQAVEEFPGLPKQTLKYHYNAQNRGVAAGRNIGLKKAKGEIILILDNDTEVTKEAVDNLLNHLDHNPACGLCAPALYSPEGALQESAKPFPGLAIKLRHLLKKGESSASELDAMASGHPYYVIGACQMFRREIIEKIGLLDEKIFYGPEDADWCERIRKAGYTIDYLPEISIIHHWQRATNRSPFSRLSLLHAKGLLHFYIIRKRLF